MTVKEAVVLGQVQAFLRQLQAREIFESYGPTWKQIDTLYLKLQQMIDNAE